MAKWWDVVVTPITDANGTVVQLLAVSRDITERRREEALRAGQHQVLEMIATGRSLPDVLDSVVRLVESQSDGMLCTVLLLDDDGVTSATARRPSLPDDYVQAIDGLSIGPRAGSCGTAMYRGTRGHRRRHPDRSALGGLSGRGAAIRTARLLVDADLFAAAEGARLVCDVLRASRARRATRNCG